ncbi:Fe2+ transport system protein A [Rubidibacter lacunae KORDI 51-2]|uniref:Fe2+ transport system protein A n=1 Tax=Rubidibacter lacunae KORDI 51-2 TaxID=582515 RepID=U5DCP1_9CHRO|nr:FeoA family protein [Rubidibacter lacunae]ERN42293.1 Fe2+ transport system protein A [Rubidibacter lacunae KORDI 51-2]
MKNACEQPPWLLSYYSGSPIDAGVQPRSIHSVPLATTRAGEWVWLDEAEGSLGTSCCNRHGLRCGAAIRIISVRPSGSVTFAVSGGNGQLIGVAAARAKQIWVSRHPLTMTNSASSDTHSHEMAPGSFNRIVGYAWAYRGYMGKLLSQGLAPGREFAVRQVRSYCGAVDIDLAGRRLVLSKIEADALVVEPINSYTWE